MTTTLRYTGEGDPWIVLRPLEASNTTMIHGISASTPTALSNSSGAGDWWIQFTDAYNKSHDYVSLPLCAIGIVINILNVVVLSRTKMVGSIHVILTSLACADMSVMLFYILKYLLERPLWMADNKYRIIGVIVTTVLVLAAHTVSLWLAVAVAIFRYILVCHGSKANTLCNHRRAKIVIMAIYVLGCIYSAPLSASFRTTDTVKNEPPDPILYSVNLWLYGFVGRVVPCFIITSLSVKILQAVRKAKRRRARLDTYSAGPRQQEVTCYERTTIMLVTIVLLYNVVEVPQAIIACWAALDKKAFSSIYVRSGYLSDMIVLLNSTLNFVLYCTMSQQFRSNFVGMFRRPSRGTSTTYEVEKVTNGNGVPFNSYQAQEEIEL